MSATPISNLLDYVSADTQNQTFEVVRRSITQALTQAEFVPQATDLTPTIDVFSVLYSSFTNTPESLNGIADYGLVGAGFSIRNLPFEGLQVDFGSPSLEGFLRDETTIPNFGSFHNYSDDANEFYSNEYDISEELSSSILTDSGLGRSVIYTSLGGNFPSNDLPVNVPILDFRPEVEGSFHQGPIALVPSQLQSGYVALLEYSDSSSYPSLLSLTESGLGSIINGIDSNDVDYVYFEVPEGVEIDTFVLDEYIAPAQESGTVTISSPEFGPVISAEFGNSDSLTTLLPGQNLLADSSLAPGSYFVEINHTGFGNFSIDDSLEQYIQRGYKFSLAPKFDFDVTIPTDFAFSEDSAVVIDLPFATSGELSQRLDWSHTSPLPGSLQLIASNDSAVPYSIQGNLPLDFNGQIFLDLIASPSDASGSKSFSIPLTVSPVNDAPELGTRSSNLTLTEDLEFDINYQLLSSIFETNDIDNDAIQFRLSNYDPDSIFVLNSENLVDTQATLDLTSDSNDIVSFTPPYNFNGNDFHVLSVTAFDGNDVSVATRPLLANIASLNDSPEVTFTGLLPIVLEDSVNSFQIDFSDVDHPNDQLTIQLDPASQQFASISSTGFLSIDTSHELFQSLSDGVVSSYSINITSSDSFGAISDPYLFKFDVEGVNDAPTILKQAHTFGNQADLHTASEDTPFLLNFYDIASSIGLDDVDSAPHQREFVIDSIGLDTYSIISQSQIDGSINNLSVGDVVYHTDLVEWSANSNTNGLVDAFSVSARDQGAISLDSSNISILVAPVDDSPFIDTPNTSIQLNENTPFSLEYSGGQFDQDSLEWLIAGPDAPYFSITSNGLLSLESTADFEQKASYSVDVILSDQQVSDQHTPYSDSRSLVVDIVNVFESQDLTLNTPVHIPGSGNILNVDLSFTQDLSLPSTYSSTLSYDPQELEFKPELSELTDFTSFDSSLGTVLLSSEDSSSLVGNPGTLAFTAVNPDATGPFNLHLAQDFDPRLVSQVSSSSYVISSKADSFIDETGHLDLSAFSAPLRIKGGVNPQDKKAEIISQSDFPMPYDESSFVVRNVSATGFDDELIVFDDLQSFTLNAGDDLLSLTSLLSQPLTGSLGVGRDTISVFTNQSPQHELTISDFELGFDKVSNSISEDSFELLHRSDFFTSNIHQLLSSAGLKLQNSSFIQSISSPSLGVPSAPNLLSTKTFISGVSPIINSSLVIEPGDLGRFLKLSLVPSNASSNAGFSLINSALDLSSDIDLGDWRLSIDDNDPSQARIGYVGTTPLNQSIPDISDLRQLLSSLTVLSDVEQSFDVSFQWHSYADSATTAVQAPVTLSSLLSSQYHSLIISDASPVTSTQSLNIDLSHNQADSILASNLNDSVSLLRNALDSPAAASDTPVVYGFAGNDSIVSSDGSRSVGGVGRDLLIAQRGLGTSQLIGGAGEDMLIGGSNDSLVAGSGDDTLIVRGSGNRLFGGSGSDIFHIHTSQFEFSNESGTGTNRILDFKSDDLIAVNNISSLGHQDIDFNGTNLDAKMLITDTAAGAKVSLTGHGDLVILQGILSSQINPDQIVFNESLPGVTPDIVSQVSLLDQSISSL